MKLQTLNVKKFETYLAESGAEMLLATNGWEQIRFRCKEGVGVVYGNAKGSFSLTGAAITAYEFFSRKRAWRAGKDYLEWERPKVVEQLMQRDGEECFFCGLALGGDVTVEHLLAVTHGGPSTLANLCLAHEACNNAAGSLPLVEKVRMFFERRTT